MTRDAPKIDPSPTDAQTGAAGVVDALLAEVDARLERRRAATGRWPEAAGLKLLAATLGCGLDKAFCGWNQLEGRFARVIGDAADPRRFTVAPEDGGGRPAFLIPFFVAEGLASDILALDLTAGSRRFWRCTRAMWAWTLVDPVVAHGRLRLRGDAHGFVRGCIAALHAEARGREAGLAAYRDGMDAAWREAGVGSFEAVRAWPVGDVRRVAFGEALRRAHAAQAEAAARLRLPEPIGALILEPTAFDWTRRGMLKGVEVIEILDQPAGGPLGRALVRLNPRIGGAQGVALMGASEPALKRRAA